ncbi:MAG TPA: hypothetical protein VFE38_02290 [Edaphobacter sp.]|nr:hypothetical protein [Edaphobacter sp.]
MKLPIATVALVFVTIPLVAQEARTGVSTPPQTEITTSEDAAPALKPRTPEAKPSAAVPAPENKVVYGSYVPYEKPGAQTAATAAAATPVKAAPFDPDANIVTTTVSDDAEMADADTSTVDGEIVTSVPEKEGELRQATLLKAKMNESLSTASTLEGAKFTASLTQPVIRQGRVILPIGSVIEGRVTEIRSGRRISGRAAIHLEPKDILLPDGTRYEMHAQLIDTNQSDQSTVDSEGTLLRRDHPKKTLAAMSVATGGAAAAGAVVGGGVGALIGAGIGAGASTVLWLKEDRQEALPKDSRLTFSLTSPMILKAAENTQTVSSVAAPVHTTTVPAAPAYNAVATVPTN